MNSELIVDYLNTIRGMLRGVISELECKLGSNEAFPIAIEIVKADDSLRLAGDRIRELREKKARQEIGA